MAILWQIILISMKNRNKYDNLKETPMCVGICYEFWHLSHLIKFGKADTEICIYSSMLNLQWTFLYKISPKKYVIYKM